MKHAHSRKDKQQPGTTPGGPQIGMKLDWTLLLYPACVLGALVALYMANHSIERSLPLPNRQQSAQEHAAGSGHSGQPAATPIPLREDSASQDSGMQPEEAGRTAAAGTAAAQSSMPDEGNGDGEAQTTAFADAIPDSSSLDALQGPDKIVTMLRLAARDGDHTRIKECLDELVGLGDAAVVSLNDLVNVGGEAGLWAAEALARIGTPMATSALLDTLAQTKEGSFKEELGRRIAGINNHDSWPYLLDAMTQTGDATVARAASASLARMADAPVLDEIMARYEVAATEAEMQRLTQLVGSIQSSKATDALLSLAGDVTSAPQNGLQEAALDALANVGDAQCLSHLLQRLEAATPGQEADIYNSVTRISNPDSHSQLLYAAAGNKEVSAEYGRTAAIEALRNYPSEETVALLERIVAQEANEKVVTAASRALDDIRRAPHVVTAKAETLKKSEEMLPLKPLIK